MAELSPDGKTPWLRADLVAPWWKIINVVIVMLGVGIISGALYGTRHGSGDFYQRINDHYLIRDGIFESGFLAAFLVFLRWRGWMPADFRMRLGWRTTLAGIGLFALTILSAYLVTHTAFILAAVLDGTILGKFMLIFLPTHFGVQPGSIHLHWIVIFVFTFLNAFYEELVYMGYVFNQWAQKYGVQKAVWFTIALRMGVHIYQGSEHILQIGVWSIIFGVWYGREGKLWPMILAHALIDLLSLSLFKIQFGAHP